MLQDDIIKQQHSKTLKMFINEPALKGNSKKPKTTAKIISEYEFSTPQESPKKQLSSTNISSTNIKKGQLSSGQSNRGMGKVLDVISLNAGPVQEPREGPQYKDQRQFEANLVVDLDGLLRKWQKSLQDIATDLVPFEEDPNIKQTQSQIKAFEHCISILETEFNQSQSIHEQHKKFLTKKILQIDDFKLRLLKDIKNLKEQNKQLRKDKEAYDEEEKAREKKKGMKRNIEEKIREEKEKMEKMRKNILEYKDKSYEQKNQFIEIQAEEFRLEKEIGQLQEEQQKHEQQILRDKKHQELQTLHQKIHQVLQNLEQQVKPHLQRKIQKMARLRSEIANIDEVLAACLQKIEDQNIIIEALKEKSYHEEVYYSEDSGGASLYEAYRRRYNDIYFGDGSGNGDNGVWNDYNRYLKHLVSKNNGLNERVYTEIPRRRNKKQSIGDLERDKVGLYTNSKELDVLDLRPSIGRHSKKDTQDKFYGNNSTKISVNPQKYRSERLPKKQSTSTKLPRLVKVQGRANEEKNLKDKVKEGIIKNTNKEEDFSLESIHSDDSKLSGEIIQVQFHKK